MGAGRGQAEIEAHAAVLTGLSSSWESPSQMLQSVLPVFVLPSPSAFF